MENHGNGAGPATDNHKMIIDDIISSEYLQLIGRQSKIKTPVQYKPAVLSADYVRGYINRCCVVKRNDQTDGYEINPSLSRNVNTQLYYVITFPWRVSGKKTRTVVNGIIEDFGVEEMNKNTLQSQSVPLTRFFPNLLEFWIGR